MADDTVKKFVFNDPNQENSYGFRIRTEGIKLDRFNKNPVMLDHHNNSNWNVIGKWTDIEVSNSILLGAPIFDTEDINGKSIAGKVERGFINAVSMGISFERENLQYIEGNLTLLECTLNEVSIVAIPSNANSIRLYDSSGEILKEQDVKTLCFSIKKTQDATQEKKQVKKESEKLKIDTMSKITLNLAALIALGFTDTTSVEESELSAKILELSTKNKGLEEALKLLRDEKESAQLKLATELVDGALKNGKFTADKKEVFLNLAKTDYNLAKSTLDALLSKTTLADKIKTAAGTTEVKTKEDFQKLSLDAQLSFRTENLDEYKEMFNIKK